MTLFDLSSVIKEEDDDLKKTDVGVQACSDEFTQGGLLSFRRSVLPARFRLASITLSCHGIYLSMNKRTVINISIFILIMSCGIYFIPLHADLSLSCLSNCV